jgi:hypothetical protein
VEDLEEPAANLNSARPRVPANPQQGDHRIPCSWMLSIWVV